MAPHRALLLGGSRFLGHLVAEALLEEGYEVICIDRQLPLEAFDGTARSRTIVCDRVEERERFMQLVKELGWLDAVVDFDSAHEAHVAAALQALTAEQHAKGDRSPFNVGHYVLVSSDAVYWALKVPAGISTGLKEGAAVEFSQGEFELHSARCRRSPLGASQLRYGGAMLGAERALEEASRTSGLAHTTLRLPDAYGPFDDGSAFWELVQAVEDGRPFRAHLPPERMRVHNSQHGYRFSLAFALDVRDAVLYALRQGTKAHGATLHVAHEEAVTIAELAEAVAVALGQPPGKAVPTYHQEAALPSTDIGALDCAMARQLLAPWRPTSLVEGLLQTIRWWKGSPPARRRHRAAQPLAQRPGGCRLVDSCEVWEVRRAHTSDGEAAFSGALRGVPALLADGLLAFSGQGVVSFMRDLMAQGGQRHVESEMRRGSKVEREVHELRHLAGNLLEDSCHAASRRLESWDALAGTQLQGSLPNPVGEHLSEPDSDEGARRRLLRMGGTGARGPLRHDAKAFQWDCLLLGRRSWRLFAPETPAVALCAEGDVSLADTFAAGPTALSVQDGAALAAFAPEMAWECEQCPGEVVVVPCGWWAQSYDQERTLSVGGRFVLPPQADVEDEEDDYECID